jgi:hypothetical protein
MSEFMAQAFASGDIIAVVFAFMAIEGVVLFAFHRLTRRGLKPFEIFTLMLPGIFLLLALRAALQNAVWPVIAGWLSAALIAHLGDLLVRVRGDTSAPRGVPGSNGGIPKSGKPAIG